MTKTWATIQAALAYIYCLYNAEVEVAVKSLHRHVGFYLDTATSASA